MILGRRYTGPEAKEAKIIRDVATSDQIIPIAMKAVLARKGIKRVNLREMKEKMYVDLLESRDTQLRTFSRL